MMPTSQIREVTSKYLLQPQTDAAFGPGISGGRVEAKRSNPILKVLFIDDLHNRGSCRPRFTIGDRGSKQLANSSPRNKNRKAIHNFSVRKCWHQLSIPVDSQENCWRE